MNLPRHNILYVDDVADLREIVEAALVVDDDLAVDSCGSVEIAIKKIAHQHPDLILLDVMMPGLDGPALLRHLKQTNPIPVVFVTARAQPAEMARLMALGAIGIIPKPFDARTLASTVREFCRKAEFSSTTAAGSSLQDVQDRLQRKFIIDAPHTVHDLDTAWRTAVKTKDYNLLKNLAHSLSGTAGTFGYDDISETAGELELAINSGIDASYASLFAHLQKLLLNLNS